MSMVGAIIGDIIGSQYEFHRPTDLNWKTCELFTDNCHFTDDTVMTVAAKEAILTDRDFAKAFRKWGNKYFSCGYGFMFRQWLRDNEMSAYNSFGNGSAMRVSPCAEFASDEQDALDLAKLSAECTHNHPEGIKGAVFIVKCINLAMSHKVTKDDILQLAIQEYPSFKYKYGADLPLSAYRDSYVWNEICQDSIPVAVRCFYESDDYESFVRNVLSLSCDADTICAIGGSIAEEYYGGTGFDNETILQRYLDDALYNMVYEK